MAIFDTNKTIHLFYGIHLTDPDQVRELQATYPTGIEAAIYDPTGGGIPPGGAAMAFAAPFRGYEEPAAGLAPFTWTRYKGTAAEGGPFPINVATFTRRSGGFWGIGGTTLHYFWHGAFILASTRDDVPIGEEAEIGPRRWVEGFETPGIGVVPYSGSLGAYFSKDAARHVGGMGLALRGATTTLEATINQYNVALVATKSWERFYIRLRKKPTATAFFWATSTFPSALAGTVLGIDPTGAIAVYTQSAVGVRTLAATASPALEEWTGLASHHAWYKIDILLDVVAGSFRVYVNGELKTSSGGTTATRHLSSFVGDRSGVANDLYLDIDDWFNADIPVRDGNERLNGKDWKNGTKIALVRPSGFSGNHSVNWTGDYRTLIQNPGSVVVATPATLTSSTSGALAAADTDAAYVVDADAGSIGVASMLVALESTRGTTSGTLGYSVAGGAAVMTAITQGVTLGANGAIYSANTVTAVGVEPVIPDATPIELRHAKGADANAATIASLQAHVEMVGKWGPEDFQAAEIAGIDTDPMGGTGPHNYPYPRSPWAQIGLDPPSSPQISHGGTYVGNGTGQDLNFRAPVHFLIIRPLTGGTGGYFWISTALGSHRNYQQGVTAQIVDAQEDSTFVGVDAENAQQQRYRIRIAGNNSQLNAVGVTYQFIAVEDPGMRYMFNGTLSHKTTLPTRTNPLMAPDFTPEFGFFFGEDASSTTTIKLYAKASGQAAASIVGFSPAVITNALTFGSGSIETQPNFHALANGVGTPFSLWRRHDGNQDTGESRVVAFGSYTGDGTASRVITWGTPVPSLRRPMFAMIFSESGANGFQRDPSHTGSNCTTQAGTDVTSGITAGDVDKFTVALGANALGVVYSYFVIPGIADCIGNNGWGCNGETIPTEPVPPVGGPWTPGPGPGGPGEPGGPTPGPCPENDPDCSGPEIEVECAPGTQAVINRALTQIGISYQIADILTDAGVEASVGLLSYGAAINQTLRDFPWPFATRWELLTLVGGSAGSAYNAEWQYAYRRPGDCVFERRIATTRGGAVDPTPPPFELGQDADGALIYANQAAAYLEYTARPTCSAGSPDALFREALTWRLAAALAIPLTRIADREKLCLDKYQGTLERAEAVVRPGKPGPSSATVDPDATIKLQIVNRALIRIGARTIRHYTQDQSREAQAARLIFDQEYLSVLGDFPWSFATAYLSPVVAGGTASVAVNGDWQYSYTLPAAVVSVRRLVTAGASRRWDPNPIQFRSTGALLFTDDTAPVVEYTSAVSVSVTDSTFRDALAWRLASSLAPSLAQVAMQDPEQLGRGPDPVSSTDPRTAALRRSNAAVQLKRQIALDAMQMYRFTLQQAERVNANQQQQAPDGDADWITGRG